MPIFQATIDDQTKSVRLSELPPEAWEYLTGGRQTGGLHKLYEKVPWLYQGINIRANSTKTVPLDLNKRGVQEPIQEPETVLEWWGDLDDIIDGMEADRALYGAAYVLKIYNPYGYLKGLRRLQPDTMKPEIDQKEGLTHFSRTVNGQTTRVELDEVVFSWLPNRKEEIGPGSPPSKAALEAAGILHNIDEYSAGYFERGAIGTLLIDVEQGGGAASGLERLEEWIKRKIQGVRNAWAVNVGKRKLNVHEIGQKINDLALPDLSNSKREDISTALGIPQSLLFSNAANFATAQADTLNFHDKTVIPEINAICADLNKQLFIPLGFRISPHPERLEIYQVLELQKAGAVVQVFRAGIISQDEARAVLNYSPVPETTDGEKPTPSAQEIPSYFIQAGVLDANEARAMIGLEPRDEAQEKQLQEIQRRLTVVQMATGAGVPLTRAFAMAGLDATGIEDSPQAQPPTAMKSALIVDIEKWERKAIKRFEEGSPEKALEFDSEEIPPSLKGAIRGALKAARDSAGVARVFNEVSAHWGAL